MSQLSTTYDAIVIGAGHSGLVGAWYLARAGWSVLVLEQRDQVGGACVTEEVIPGYRGNTVANSSHSLDPIVAEDMQLHRFGLRYVGAELGSLTLFSDGRGLPQWPDRTRRREELRRFAKGEADMKGFSAVLQTYQEVAQQSGVSFYEPPPSFAEVASRFDTPDLAEKFESVFLGSIADLTEKHLISPDLRSFFASTAVATNLIGPKTPGSAYFLVHRPLYEASMAKRGVSDRNELMLSHTFPVGGIGAVTQAMAAANRALGVTIETDAPVTEVICRDNRVVGVALEDGREFQAPRVLSNVNPKTTLTRLVPASALEERFLERARGIKMRGSSAKVHLAMDGTPRFACAESDAENEVFLRAKFRTVPSIDLLQESYNEATVGRWHPRTSINGIFSSLDPEMTPPGCHFVSLSVRSVPYDLAEGNWDLRRDELIEDVVTTLETYIPNLRSILVDTHVYTPLDLERKFGMAEGNGAHGDIVPGNVFNARPLPECANYATPVSGLYLCGVGVWPANFVSGITGYNASQRILREAG